MKLVPFAKKAVVLLASVLFLNVLQTAVFPYFQFGGIVPNFFVVLTSFYGFMRNRREGMITGLICGLIMDFQGTMLFGTHTIILLSLGFLNGLSRKVFFGDDVKLPILFVGISDILYGLYIYLTQFLYRGQTNYNFYMMNIILPEAIYSVLVSFVLYFVYIKLFVWLDHEERKVEHVL